MADENEVIDVVADAPAIQPVEENKNAEAQTPVEAQSEPSETVQEPVEDWKDKELSRKHAKIKEREREIEQLRREKADLEVLAQARAEGREVPNNVVPQDKTQDQIQAAARQLREQERYQEQLVNTNSLGEKAYGEKWSKALDRLATFGTVDAADMQAILHTDNPSKVLFELGNNPAEYQRIMDLPQPKRLTEIVKISMRETPKPKPNISNAPAPTESVASRVVPELDLANPKISDTDWYAVRLKQKEERFKQQRALGKR